MIIKKQAYARAGLLGNPSDGYNGKTISISVKNFAASVMLYESPELRIEAQEEDRNVFKNIHHLAESVSLCGYYGGERLIKATLKTFYDYCRDRGIKLLNRNFTIRYHSSIPRQVGLAGSSAIITATMRALLAFFEVSVEEAYLPTLILRVEQEELGINAGLQDRVIQVYEGCVHMDFEAEYVQRQGYGRYRRMAPSLLPPLYMAYKTELSKVSGTVLNTVRSRYLDGDREVIATLREIASLADAGANAIEAGNIAELNRLIDQNFDLRRKIMFISKDNLRMVETARRCGASAKFTGSGGAIIGLVSDDEMLTRLIVELKKQRVRVIRPYLS